MTRDDQINVGWAVARNDGNGKFTLVGRNYKTRTEARKEASLRNSKRRVSGKSTPRVGGFRAVSLLATHP